MRIISDKLFISSIEDNLFSTLLAFGQWPRIEVHDESDILWAISDVPFPLFNSVMRARLAPDKVEVAIQNRIAQAKSHHVPLLWWTGPATQPPDLGDHLERHGFIHEAHMPGMAVELAKVPKGLPVPRGLIVRQAKDPATLKHWSQACSDAFGMPEFVAEAFHEVMTHVAPNTFRAYLGWLEGKPVATSLLTLAAGCAGIYNVSTIPQARRKGIGALMTALPLQDARAEGYTVGILHASEMGVGVYRSLGFQEYCKIGQYVWPGEQTDEA